MNLIETKQCSKCKNVLSIEHFELRADTKKYRGDCKQCRNAYVKQYKSERLTGKREKKTVTIENDSKQCRVCQVVKPLEEFPTRKTAHGFRHECKQCKQLTMSAYYQTTYNAVRRQRMRNDINRRLARAQRNYIYKCLTQFKNKKQSSLQYLHCSLSHLKDWLEFQFIEDMSWSNYGNLWTVDHVLPLSEFNLDDEKEQYIAFDWKNLQPSKTNFSKSSKILFSEYFKVLMFAHKFIQMNNIGSQGYQGVSQSLHWLREKLGYGKNPSDNNGQPAANMPLKANGSETVWFWVF